MLQTLKAPPPTAGGSQCFGRDWFFHKLQSRLSQGSGVWVVAAEPGWGKTTLARAVAARHSGAVLASVRDPQEFWQELDARLPGSPGTRHSTRFSILQRLKSAPLFIVDNLDRLQVPGLPKGLHGLESCPCPVLAFTRPGPHLRNLETHGHQLDTFYSHSPENLADLATYLRTKTSAQAELALGRSFGNFMVAQSLLSHGLGREEAILRGLWQLVEETLDRVSPELHPELLRLLCLLAEAGEPLHEQYMADFLGITAARVQVLLAACEPLLIDEQARYRLFNPWMSRTLSVLLMRDMEPVHAAIIAHFRETFPSWDEMSDDYGWHHLAHHCDRYARTARRKDFSVLHWLAEGPFARLKLKKTRDLYSVLADLRRGLVAALEERDLPRIVYYGFQIPRLRREWAAHNLHELADVGDLTSARNHALLLHSEANQFKGLLLLTWQAADEGQMERASELLDLTLQVPLPELESDELPLVQRICASLLNVMTERQADILRLLDREENPGRSALNYLTLGLMDSLEDRLRLLSLEQGRERSTVLPNVDQEKLLRFVSKSLCSLQRPDLAATLHVVLEPVVGDITERKAFTDRLTRLAGERSEPRLVDSLLAMTEKLMHARPRPDWLLDGLGLIVQSLINVRTPLEKMRGLFHLSRSAMELGPGEKTTELFERLLTIAESIEDLACQCRCLADLGVSMFRLKEFVRSNNLISRAAAKAFQLEDHYARGQALAFVAGATAQIGHNVRARDLAFNSLESLESQGAGANDFNCRAALAVSVMTSTSIERSVEAFQYSAEEIRRLEGLDPKLRALALGTLAEGAFKLGSQETARVWLNQGLAIARVMESGWQQSSTLAKLAVHEFEMGDRVRFEQIIQEALESLAAEPDGALRSEALMAISEARRTARDPRAELVLQTVLKELDRLDPTTLPTCRTLIQAAACARATAQTEMVEHLIHKAQQATNDVPEASRDDFLLGLMRAQLAFGDYPGARQTHGQLRSTRLTSVAGRELALALISVDTREALHWINRIPLRSDRLQAVILCVMQLQKELRPSRMAEVRQAMAELTVFATEDEATVDIVLARWLSADPESRNLELVARKMGWINEPGYETTGNTVPLRSHA